MSVVEMFLSQGRATQMPTREDDRNMERLAEVAKTVLWQKAEELVRSAGAGPVLFSYQSDGTPALTQRRWVSTIAGTAKTLRRQGGRSTEYLLQKGFVLVPRLSGVVEVTALFGEPKPLSNGKDTWCMYAAAKAFFPTLRELGHRGISLSHYAFDRAVFSACSRKMLQLHMEKDEAYSTRNPDDAALSRLTNWQVLTPCCNHDVQNALKWSLSRHVDNTEALKDLFIAVASLRNAFDLLHGHIADFLGRCLEPVDEPDEYEESYRYWTDIGVESVVAEQLAELSVRWHNGRLRVRAGSDAASQGSLVGRVAALIMAVLRFRKFAESRWCTVGDSCRSLLAAMSVGLDGLVEVVRADPRASDFHMHGYARLVGPARQYCAIAGMSCVVTDSFLLALLEDDRVGARVDELEATMTEELEWLSGIKHSTWARVAALVAEEYSPHELRSDVLEAASLAASFVHRSVIKPARRCPWTLARGDIQANIQTLVDQNSAPKDPLAQKVQALARCGFNVHMLERGLQLLNEVRWSTAVVEQGHGSTAAVHRYHPMYSPEKLALHAFLHMFAKLLAPPRGARSSASRHDAAVARIEAKRPSRVNGRGMFLKDVFLQARQELAEGARLSNARRLALVEQHAAAYDALPLARRQSYEEQARARAEEQEQSLRDEMDYFVALARLERKRYTCVDTQSRAMLAISSCKLSDLDRANLANVWDRGFAAARIKAMREAANLAPSPPPEDEQRALSRHNVSVDPYASGGVPSWCALVCRHRSAFTGAALTFTRDGEVRVYMFLYAKQSPMHAMFTPLYVTNEVLRVGGDSSAESRVRALSDYYDWTFDITLGEYVMDSEIAHDEDTLVAVLPGLFFAEGSVVASHGELIPLEEFVLGLPQDRGSAAQGHAGERAATPQHPSDELRQKFPWLKAHIGGDPAVGSSSSGGACAARCDEEAEPLGDAEADAAFEALDAKRREWDANDVLPATDFRTSIRGGAWTMANRGVSFDCIIGAATTDALKTWCRRYTLQASVSFAYAKYSEEVASALALGWCQRMQMLYDVYVASGEDRFVFKPEDCAELEEHPVFAAAADALSPHDPAFARATQIRGIVPSAPRW